jgi:hypothetical protein
MFVGFLALLLPVLSQAGEFSFQQIVQTGLLRESDLVVRNVTDLISKKTCMAFYIRTAGTSSVIDCYDVLHGFGTEIRQVGHLKEDDVIIRKIEDTKNGRICLVAYVATPGTSPAVDCYSITAKFKDNLEASERLHEGDLRVDKIVDDGAMRTCLVAYVKTKGTSPSVFCYASQAKANGSLQQVGPPMKEGDLVVRKIKDAANKKACMVTYVSTAGTNSRMFCFDEQ